MGPYVLVSSYTEKLGHVQSPSCPHSDAITVFRHAPAEAEDDQGFGRLVVHFCEDTCKNASYLCANKSRTRVYAVNEQVGEVGNLVIAYEFNNETGKLLRINDAETGGDAACHLELSPDEQLLAVANYVGGSTALFEIRGDGGIGERIGFHQHEGHATANPDRQDGPHAHMVKFDAAGRFLLVPDLGKDDVCCFAVNTSRPGLEPTENHVELQPGSGPRHLQFHSSGKFVYVLNELLSTVCSYTYDDMTGGLTKLQEPLSTVPEGTKVGVGAQSHCAAIRISPDGKFVYTSNRGHDSITVFKIEENGNLTCSSCHLTAPDDPDDKDPWAHAATWPPCHCPRDFAFLGNQGEWLIAANQDSDSLVLFARDLQDGSLSKSGLSWTCAAPVCVLPL